MPRRGRHRTTLPVRLIAAFAALLVTGGIAVAAGSAAAQDDSGDGGLLGALTSQGSDDSGSDDSSSDGSGSDGSGSDGSGSDDSGDGRGDGDQKDGENQNADQKDAEDAEDGDQDQQDQARAQEDGRNGEGEMPDEAQVEKADAEKKVEFPGREKARAAGADDYVDITEVDANGGRGEGGVFGGGSYTVNCGVGDHNNSDNYMAAPGKRNGAQHVHDYVGNESTDANSDHDSLEDAGTSCSNGDKSAFFWPVLRDLDGTGDDVGEDGGSLDGNVGSIVAPTSADLTFHGHPGQETEPLPAGLMMIMGNAKAKAQGGDNANAKYTCSGFTDRVTDKYPICPSGSKLIRMLDYPSCWDGQNLESKDFRSHIFYPESDGNCGEDTTPVPQLRITLTYDQPAGDRFAIDSFPDNQHDPSTDHSDYENVAPEQQNEAGARCIAEGLRCGKS